ncbi:unnamed protein product [Psylliodes chrysocephalus]|uniref:Lipase n=1 Tax=Psylliodes chrysocephalus TaxID=3402493 RepID=A0A9P0GEQ0_9CUCU|nr:unnamed protein product [Psylliodes chrysocephala]
MLILGYILILKLLYVDCLIFKVHPDAGLNIPQLLTKYGYPVEIHDIITEDGYIITIFRIPHGKNSTKVHKYPVILFPGTCGCSENFVATGPEHAIGFYLSDKGFDVWLANNRGNRHARKHKTLNPEKDRKFWNFGWHEVAIYDTPSIIDYVLRVSNASQIFYIGHSQGTTTFLAMAADKPEYNKKVKLSIQLAPTCFLNYTKTIARVLGKHSLLLENLARTLDFYVLFARPINDFLNNLARTFCSEMTIFVDLCYLILYFFNYNSQNLIDPMHAQLVLQSSPAGCSFKELLHYLQIIDSGTFSKYDYGPKKNLKYYGEKKPPLYNLSQITSPMSLFSAKGDLLVPQKGARVLAKMLPNLESLYIVPNEDFNHVDFIFSSVTKELVNKPIYELFVKYINKD